MARCRTASLWIGDFYRSDREQLPVCPSRLPRRTFFPIRNPIGAIRARGRAPRGPVKLADRSRMPSARCARRRWLRDRDLVVCHPETGKPLDRSKLVRSFKQAIDRTGVHRITFHELRHPVGTRMAAAGTPMRTSSTGWATLIRRRRRSTRTTSRVTRTPTPSIGRSGDAGLLAPGQRSGPVRYGSIQSR